MFLICDRFPSITGTLLFGSWSDVSSPPHPTLLSSIRWALLPDVCPPSREVRGTALGRQQFRALPAAEVARLYPGTTKASMDAPLRNTHIR